MPRFARVRVLLSLLAPALVWSACQDRTPLGPGGLPERGEEFGQGAVRLRLSDAPGPQPGQVTYTLRLVTEGHKVGAYQGALTFTPGSLEVLSAHGPAAPAHESHLVNAAGAHDGSIRFAAYSLDGMSGDLVLTVVARPMARAGKLDLEARLDVVADGEGRVLWQTGGDSPVTRTVQASMYPNPVGPAYLAFLASSSSTVQVAPGAKVAVPLIVDLAQAGALNLASLQSQLTWAPARLAFDSIRANGALGWTFTPNTSGAASGNVAFTTSSGTALASTSTMATAYFTATANAGGTTLRLLPGAAANAQLVSVLPDLRPRALAVCVGGGSGVWGDANDDAAVNVIDAQQIARYTVGLSVANVTAVTTRGDVTDDGSVNVIDAQQIARFTVQLSASPRINTPVFIAPEISTITLDPTGAQWLVTGGSLQLGATALDGAGSDQTGCATVGWTSSNSGAATVNASGLVSAVAPGTTTITATSGTTTATAQVTVTAVTTPLPHPLAVGHYHSCDLVGGQAWCWGGNEYGQLGNGTRADADRPVAVSGGITFQSLTANARHTCGLAGNGAAWCWGAGDYGRLGNGTSSGIQDDPVLVLGGRTYSKLVSGQNHTCGLTPAGTIYCWGRNQFGELGDGTTTQRTSPVLVTGGLTYTDIAAGYYHTCALTPSGAAYCWGGNSASQIGDGTTTQRTRPTPVAAGAITWGRIAGGAWNTCALRTNGDAYCWGSNTYGQLGNGAVGVDMASPVAVASAPDFVDIYTGDTSCGITAAGAAWCWGDNSLGEVGDGTSGQKLVPAAVAGGFTFDDLASGPHHTCAIGASGTRCWGDNGHGQLGSGIPTSLAEPVPASLANVSGVSASGAVSCATVTGGAGYCWGVNTFGGLGDNSTTTRYLPVAVAGTESFALIAAGASHTCGLNDENAPFCWGRNSYGQLGDGTGADRYVPTALAGGPVFTQVSVGAEHSCGLTAAGNAYCWGFNMYGQLGDGTTTSRNQATAVSGSLEFASITVGELHTCGRTTATGAAYCWGRNTNGVLGDGSTTERHTPTAVAGGHQFTRLSAGYGHTCGIDASNDAWCWGTNLYGQLGDGSNTTRTSPVQVTGSLDFAEIATGFELTCALTTGGAAWCWGNNEFGQVGTGNRTDAAVTSPSAVAGGLTFSRIAAGTLHACGVSGSTANCWGSNEFGQLGTGTGYGVVTSPAAVER